MSAARGGGLVFGGRLRAHRLRLGWTQEDLAGKAGVDVKTIRSIENGRSAARMSTVRLLVDALELEAGERERLRASAAPQPADALEPAAAPEPATGLEPAVLSQPVAAPPATASLPATAPPAAGPQPATAPTPAQLPLDAYGFTGRAAQLDALDAIAGASGRQPTAVVITAVSGTAGVGKTTLAVHWAHRVRHRFPDGQLYLNLRGFDPDGRLMPPIEAVRRLLDALGVAPERVPPELDAQAALYRSLLAGRRVLVVLDNARDADQVRPLLPGTPAALAVVTSRNRLTGLVAVEGAHPVDLDLLSTVEARELLLARLGAERVAAEPDAADAIVAACAGLPLALAIAAARARQTGFPLAAIAAELGDAARRLDALDTGDRSGEIRAVFSWSYTALTPPAARMFRLLGLHPGPDVSTAAAASLAGRPLAETRRLLTELVRANLLTEHVPDRYTWHDLLRSYATELTRAHDPHDQRRAATARLLDHYIHSAHAADRLVQTHRDPIHLPLAPPAPDIGCERFADHEAAMAWLAVEHLALLAAQRYAADTGFEARAWQLAWVLDTFLDRRGQWHALVDAWRIALAAAERLDDPAARAYPHRRLAHADTRAGRHAEAHAHYRRALDLYTRAGHEIGQAQTHHNLAILRWRQGRPDRALDHAQQALALFQAAGHERGIADAVNDVGWYHTELGNYTEALRYGERALALFQQLGTLDGQAATWDSLGHAHQQLGHHDRAIDCYRHAIALFRRVGDRYEEATTLTRLGDTRHVTGDPPAARERWQEALAILTELNHRDAEQVRARIDALDAG
jgi:tetratricopeptide (TPR) repeat protein/transcriptional regulator with XRE-family HTH domain